MGKTQGSTTSKTWHGRYTRGDHDRALGRLLKDIKQHPDAATGEPTNEQRRRRALWALQQYATLTGDKHAPVQQHAADLLADLLHLNDAGLVNFSNALDMARIHHAEEAK